MARCVGRAIAVGALNDVYLSCTCTDGRLSARLRSGYIPGSSTEQRQTCSIAYNRFGSMTGASVSYDSDKLERISNDNNSASPAASYICSGSGGLGRVTDNAAGKFTDYSYDGLNRLTSMTERNGTYGVQVYLCLIHAGTSSLPNIILPL